MLKTQRLLWIMIWSVFTAQASDWPRWGGPMGNGHAPEGAPVPESLPSEPNVIWRIKVGPGLGSPVVADGRVFYLDNQQGKETLQAVDAATGKALWRAPLDTVFQDSQSSAGPRSTPVADGERVYAQSCQGELQCLEASSGKVIWKSQNDIPGHAGPVLAEIAESKQVVSFTAEGVLGLAAEDGAFLWRVPIQTRLGRHAVTPIIVDDTVVVSSYLAGLIGIKVTRENGTWKAERAWVEKSLGINFASPVAVGQYLYGLGPGRKLICVKMSTGQKAWSQADPFSGTLEKEHAGMVAFKDRLLILGENGRLLLVAADPAEYRLEGSVQVCGSNWCGPAYVDGKLVLRDERELMCLKIVP